jgi:hypothetical protein
LIKQPSLLSSAVRNRLLRHEFPPELNWFKHYIVRLDLGHQGFEKDYECPKVIIPKKKLGQCLLSESEKQQNKAKSSEKISVEHAIRGMNRYC